MCKGKQQPIAPSFLSASTTRGTAHLQFGVRVVSVCLLYIEWVVGKGVEWFSFVRAMVERVACNIYVLSTQGGLALASLGTLLRRHS